MSVSGLIGFLAPQNGKKLDPDHRLLLTAATPLLQSRNSAVVIAVVNLFLDLAPQNEIGIVVQPLISLSSSDRRETKFLATKLLTQFTRKWAYISYKKIYDAWSRLKNVVKALIKSVSPFGITLYEEFFNILGRFRTTGHAEN